MSPLIEIYRGVAAMMVMLCHYAGFVSDQRSGLNFFYTGVDFFFVISGFVFAPVLLGKADGSVGGFVIRRLFRLYPLYLLAIAAYVGLHNGVPDWGIVWRHVLFLHTTRSVAEAFYFNPAFWSLPAEVEFYALLAVVLFTRFAMSGRCLALFFVASLFINQVLMHHCIGKSFSCLVYGVHLPGVLPEFLMGALAFHVVSMLSARDPTNRLTLMLGLFGLSLLGALGVFFVIGGDQGVDSTHGLFTLSCALGYACLVVSGCVFVAKKAYGPRLLRLGRILGGMSYPAYLFHSASPQLVKIAFPAIGGWALLLASVALTISFSLLIHHLLEEPARLFGHRLSRKYSSWALRMKPA